MGSDFSSFFQEDNDDNDDDGDSDGDDDDNQNYDYEARLVQGRMKINDGFSGRKCVLKKKVAFWFEHLGSSDRALSF